MLLFKNVLSRAASSLKCEKPLCPKQTAQVHIPQKNRTLISVALTKVVNYVAPGLGPERTDK